MGLFRHSMNQSDSDDMHSSKSAGAADDALHGGSRFIELLGAHERDLFGYIFSMTGNWDDSQEIMQRLRIRVWEQFSQYDSSRPFGAWARAIAYYLVLAFRKERSRQREYFTERIIQLLDEAYASEHDEVSTSREALVDCLGKLSSDKQKLVTEYYATGGPAALADSLGKTENSLRQAVLRIRRMLLDCVQRSVSSSQ
jgi:RNA polymerase sigma-70 factor (ECF subfamily)